MALETVIFDMDGVIVDSEPLHHAAYHAMFDEVGIEVSEDEYAGLTGRSTIDLCKKLKKSFRLSHDAEELMAMKRSHYDRIFEKDQTFGLIAGVRSLIHHYSVNGLTLILASSSSMRSIDRIFSRFDLDRYFAAKISGADLKQSKPHPEIFERAAQASGTPKHACMVIEDAHTGVQAAKAAGIFCVGYDSTHSKRQDLRSANLLIADFEEIYLARISHYF